LESWAIPSLGSRILPCDHPPPTPSSVIIVRNVGLGVARTLSSIRNLTIDGAVSRVFASRTSLKLRRLDETAAAAFRN